MRLDNFCPSFNVRTSDGVSEVPNWLIKRSSTLRNLVKLDPSNRDERGRLLPHPDPVDLTGISTSDLNFGYYWCNQFYRRKAYKNLYRWVQNSYDSGIFTSLLSMAKCLQIETMQLSLERCQKEIKIARGELGPDDAHRFVAQKLLQDDVSKKSRGAPKKVAPPPSRLRVMSLPETEQRKELGGLKRVREPHEAINLFPPPLKKLVLGC